MIERCDRRQEEFDFLNRNGLFEKKMFSEHYVLTRTTTHAASSAVSDHRTSCTSSRRFGTYSVLCTLLYITGTPPLDSVLRRFCVCVVSVSCGSCCLPWDFSTIRPRVASAKFDGPLCPRRRRPSERPSRTGRYDYGWMIPPRYM